MADGKALRLIVHRLQDGRIAGSLLLRSWRGAEAWDRRLVPPRALGTPPPPPPGFPGNLWYPLCVISTVVGAQWTIEVSREAGPEPLGAVGGESAVWPIVRDQDRG